MIHSPDWIGVDRGCIRDSASVRTWPEQQMSGFAKDVLPDSDLDDLMAYLRAQAFVSKGGFKLLRTARRPRHHIVDLSI